MNRVHRQMRHNYNPPLMGQARDHIVFEITLHFYHLPQNVCDCVFVIRQRSSSSKKCTIKHCNMVISHSETQTQHVREREKRRVAGEFE